MFLLITLLFPVQVEVSGGRGRPSTIVDKDEGLGKVNLMTYLNFFTCIER